MSSKTTAIKIIKNKKANKNFFFKNNKEKTKQKAGKNLKLKKKKNLNQEKISSYAVNTYQLETYIVLLWT